jgi:flagellar motor protein MotB
MKKHNSNFLWPSFADLMTSLFFVMLALYVLTYVYMKNQQRATEAQLKKIKEVQHAVNALDHNYFHYDSTYKRFTLTRQISFPKKGSIITDPEDKSYLINVGQNIQKLITDLRKKYQGQNISYMVVIEGMASNDAYSNNFELSYQRSLALYRLWLEAGIKLDASMCELQIAGSGSAGIGRSKEEALNQRFLIQIIPKIGTLN